jgi:hypothetical protein
VYTRLFKPFLFVKMSFIILAAGAYGDDDDDDDDEGGAIVRKYKSNR